MEIAAEHVAVLSSAFLFWGWREVKGSIMGISGDSNGGSVLKESGANLTQSLHWKRTITPRDASQWLEAVYTEAVRYLSTFTNADQSAVNAMNSATPNG